MPGLGAGLIEGEPVPPVAYILAGYDGSDSVLEVSQHDIESGSTTNTGAQLPNSVDRGNAESVSRVVYYLGGYQDGGSIYEFDPDSSVVTELSTSLTYEGGGGGSGVVDGKIYILAGEDSSEGNTNYVQEYDPSSDSVAVKDGALGGSLAFNCAAVYDGSIYSFGGVPGFNDPPVDDIYRYDVAADSVTQMSSTLPTGLSSFSANTVGEKIYTFGGQDGSDTVRDLIYEYDPSSDSITTLSTSLPQERRYASSVVYDGKVYIYGGQDSGYNAKDTIYEFDPSDNSITTLSESLVVPIYVHSVALV